MASTVPFRRVAVIGTGLIGGSFALALRKHFPDTIVIGYSRAGSLERALARGVIQEAVSDLALAVRGADLVYICAADRRDHRSAQRDRRSRRAARARHRCGQHKSRDLPHSGDPFSRRRTISRRASHGRQGKNGRRSRRCGIISRRAVRARRKRRGSRSTRESVRRNRARNRRAAGVDRRRHARLGGGHRLAPSAARVDRARTRRAGRNRRNRHAASRSPARACKTCCGSQAAPTTSGATSC